MTQALEALIQEPCGCFEQTSSTVYPLVMAQQYFMSHQGVPSSLIEKSADILSRGYDRLLGFECKSGGFEWFGADPGHDALTAYGLLEFTDMARCGTSTPRHARADPRVAARPARRQGRLHPQDAHLAHLARRTGSRDGYNTWALLYAGIDADLATEVTWLRDAGREDAQHYVVALAANVMLLGRRQGRHGHPARQAGRQAERRRLAQGRDGVRRRQRRRGADDRNDGPGGAGVAARIPSYAANVEKGIRYLAEQCKAGRFGSTQSTVLALQAIVAYDQARAKPKAPGELQLVVDGKPIGEAGRVRRQDARRDRAAEARRCLPAGKHTVEVHMTGGSQMPYSVAARFSRLKPDSAEECKLHWR